MIVLAAYLPIAAETAFQTIARGVDSHIVTRRELVVRTAGWWQLVWNKHSGSLEFPDVDFSRLMVIAVFGGKAAAGTSLEIVSVTKEGGSTVVRYRERRSVATTASSDSGAAPFHVIVVPLDRSPVTFVKTAGP
jgi:hypothetical protein